MTDINIIVDGEPAREYEFDTLEDEHAEQAIELILNHTDDIISTLDDLNAIKMKNKVLWSNEEDNE